MGLRTEGDIADVLGVLEADGIADLERRLLGAEEHLRRGLYVRLAAGIDEFLEEDLAEDAVGLLAEDGREDDGDAIGGGLDVDGLLVAVLDLHELGRVGRRAAVLERERVLERELEGRAERDALEQRCAADEGVACVCDVGCEAV